MCINTIYVGQYVWGKPEMNKLQIKMRKGELAMCLILRSSNIFKYGINGGNEDTDGKKTNFL
jgi:hypothetical protein